MFPGDIEFGIKNVIVCEKVTLTRAEQHQSCSRRMVLHAGHVIKYSVGQHNKSPSDWFIPFIVIEPLEERRIKGKDIDVWVVEGYYPDERNQVTGKKFAPS